MAPANTHADIVDKAITSRSSVRRFLDKPVDRETVETILKVSSRAPSGTNMQPWHVHIVAGDTKEALTNEILDAHYRENNEHKGEYEYYPSSFYEPYKSRRKAVGLDLYRLLGIEKGASQKMRDQHGRNYGFFDAPIGLIFTIDNGLKIGSWLDYGMFLQNIMTASRARGLDTCTQAAFAQYHTIIRKNLNIEDNHIVICGMSLGYCDHDAIENKLNTTRVPLSEFATFHDM